MSSGITVKVAFDPMYVDYINDVWGYGYDEPILARADVGHIGMTIKGFLMKRPKIHEKRNYEPNKHIVFELPWYRDMDVRYYNYISGNGETDIRKWIRSIFFHELHNHVVERYRAGWVEIKGSIVDFLDFHNIDPDHYNYDSVKKEYYRFRKRKDKKKSRKKSLSLLAVLSLICPPVVPYFQYFC